MKKGFFKGDELLSKNAGNSIFDCLLDGEAYDLTPAQLRGKCAAARSL
jgi:hypothetical protein